jgi:DNA-directed RNA polymerase subunit M/transcription elongation factor TFIIS
MTDIRSICISLSQGEIDDTLEENIYQKSQEQPDPMFWYFRKMLFLVSLKDPNNTDINLSLVDNSNWVEQLSVNLPRKKKFIRRFVEDRIPKHFLEDSKNDIMKRRLQSLGFDIAVVNDLILGILSYSYLVATESGIPITYNNYQMRQIVRAKYLQIFSSLENNTCKDNLFDQVLDKKVPAFNLAFMTRHQLLPKMYEKRFEAQAKRQAEEDVNIIDPKDMDDGLYECDRCGQKKTTFEERQLRSADEPMTNFITCHICRLTWKEN